MACGVVLEAAGEEQFESGKIDTPGGKLYSPRIFPGRSNAGRGGAPLIHVWDKHGKIVFEDAIPGIGGTTYGIALDRDNALYLMSNATRVLDGKPYLNKLSGTLMKAIPNKSRLLSQKSSIPLTPSEYPNRPIDLIGSGLESAWAEGIEWMYGGVGYDGKNAGNGYRLLECPRRIRLFRPIVRAGTRPVSRRRPGFQRQPDPPHRPLRQLRHAGPGSLIPLGGDEVGMVHGAYLATHTDHRLFVADGASDQFSA